MLQSIPSKSASLIQSPSVCSHNTLACMGKGLPMRGCMDCLAVLIDDDRDLAPSQIFRLYQILGYLDCYEYFGGGLALSKDFHPHYFN